MKYLMAALAAVLLVALANPAEARHRRGAGGAFWVLPLHPSAGLSIFDVRLVGGVEFPQFNGLQFNYKE